MVVEWMGTARAMQGVWQWINGGGEDLVQARLVRTLCSPRRLNTIHVSESILSGFGDNLQVGKGLEMGEEPKRTPTLLLMHQVQASGLPSGQATSRSGKKNIQGRAHSGCQNVKSSVPAEAHALPSGPLGPESSS